MGNRIHTLRMTAIACFIDMFKMIQEIMGHADISTTLDVYTDLTRAKKVEAFEELEGKIKIS